MEASLDTNGIVTLFKDLRRVANVPVAHCSHASAMGRDGIDLGMSFNCVLLHDDACDEQI